jgi:tRNA G10  N-methylase Trm11
MVEGSKENLERYGTLNHEIKKGDISEVKRKFKKFDAVVTDLPYGKASKKSEEAVEKFLELIDNFDGKAVFMYNEPEVGSYSSDFEIYEHKNLTRYIFIEN